jgi:hypothetical protein
LRHVRVAWATVTPSRVSCVSTRPRWTIRQIGARRRRSPSLNDRKAEGSELTERPRRKPGPLRSSFRSATKTARSIWQDGIAVDQPDVASIGDDARPDAAATLPAPTILTF